MAASEQGGLRVLVSDEQGRRVRAPGVARWLTRVAPSRARGLVSVALVSDRRIRALNRTFRRKDAVTDVLSFPAMEGKRGGKPVPPIQPVQPFLGDIVIARGLARRQARAAGHSALTEFRVLALHGLLHLLGYDHEQDRGRMLRIERRLRRAGGLREGLIERRAGSRGRAPSSRYRHQR